MYMSIVETTPDYITINLYDKRDDYFFGYLDISILPDCYVISGRVNKFEIGAEIELLETRKRKLRAIFINLREMILEEQTPLKLDRPVLILDDELISRDAIKYMKLKRVPRYCGYYFI